METEKHLKLLYMEDDDGLARLLQRRLQKHRLSVDVAKNGKIGVEMVSGGQYDVLLLDYNMPVVGGLDVIKELAKRGITIPTIVVTGDGNEHVAVEAMKMGATDYIVKDTNQNYLDLLPLVIHNAVQRQQLVEEKNRMFQTVQESEQRYRRLVELSPEGIAIASDGKIAYVNPAGVELLEAESAADILGRSITDFVHEGCHEIFTEHMKLMRTDDDRVPWLEERFVTINGRKIDVEVCGIPFKGERDNGIQIIFKNISRRKATEHRLQQLAHYDSLTNLPNRVLLKESCKKALQVAERNKSSFAVFFMDLDRFKEVNDQYGHEAGDALLVQVAGRLQDAVRKSDTIARLGGDEFVLLATPVNGKEDAEIVAKRIIASIAEPFAVSGVEVSVGTSIGISMYPRDGKTPEMLIKSADIAMYMVKRSGRNSFKFYKS